jgi:hypothetical protein
VLTEAHYAGWPRAVSAIPLARKVFEARTGAGRAGTPLDILRRGSQPAARGSPEFFTGSVTIDQCRTNAGERRKPVSIPNTPSTGLRDAIR